MISTHILDTSCGAPAASVVISLEKKNSNGDWISLGQGLTNIDGRLAFDIAFEVGIYRLNFGIEEYFKTKNTECFFMDNSIIFSVKAIDRKYHVPILLNPYGYTTYRGS